MSYELPPMDKIIGDINYVDIIAGGFDGSLHEDGSITVELQAITGQLMKWINKMSAKDINFKFKKYNERK